MAANQLLVIKGGRVVNDDCMFDADVLIKDGKILEVGPALQTPAGARVIDAAGKMVIPGGIDPHVHLELPFQGMVTIDDYYHGTKAALSGGTTMVIDFVVPGPGQSLVDAYDQWMSRAVPKVCCDFAFSVAVTGWRQSTAKEMELLCKERGVNSFKFYMAYKDSIMVHDDEMFLAMKECAKLRALARVHAENGDVIFEKEKELVELGITGPEGHTQARPEELEAEATNRACVLAQQANCPLYVVHVMTKGAARRIAEHRLNGQVIFGEPVAAGLACDGSHYYHPCWRHAAGFVMSPPLSRDPTTPSALMDLLASHQLHLIGTDNCTFTAEQKSAGKEDFRKIPNGINGVEDRLSVVWQQGVQTGKIDPMRFVSVTSTTAAKIFNIYPRKGRIAAGSDADVVVWNPNATRTISASTHHQAVDFNIFEGMKCHGVAEVTITRGVVAWENGSLNAVKGSGKFVPLATDSPIVYGTVDQRAKLMAPRKVERST